MPAPYPPKHLRTFTDSLVGRITWCRVDEGHDPHGPGPETTGLDLDEKLAWVVVNGLAPFPRSAVNPMSVGSRKNDVQAQIGVGAQAKRAVLRGQHGPGNGEAVLDSMAFSIRAKGRVRAEFLAGDQVLATMRRYRRRSKRNWEVHWLRSDIAPEHMALAYVLAARYCLGRKRLRDRDDIGWFGGIMGILGAGASLP